MKQTKRQSEVLILVQQGLSNKVIARQLSIEEATVKVYVTQLFKLYGVSNRTQLGMVSSQGLKPTLPKLKAVPFCWIKRIKNRIDGIVFVAKQPDTSWEPLYLAEEQGEVA